MVTLLLVLITLSHNPSALVESLFLATSSILATSSDALVTSSFLFLVVMHLATSSIPLLKAFEGRHGTSTSG